MAVSLVKPLKNQVKTVKSSPVQQFTNSLNWKSLIIGSSIKLPETALFI